jgi:hypothetical protein
MQTALGTGSWGFRDRTLPSRWALGRCRQWGRLVGPRRPAIERNGGCDGAFRTAGSANPER